MKFAVQQGLDESEFRPDPITDYGVIAAIECLKITDHVVTSLVTSFDLYHLFIAGNEDCYKILDGFEIQQDQTRDCPVSCSAYLENSQTYKYNRRDVATNLAPLFLQ